MAPSVAPQPAVVDLFREHGGAIYRFAFVLTGSAADAEDVLQETFLKLVQHVDTGGSGSNIRGWLFTVAAHASRDRQRRRRRWLPWDAAAEPSVEPPELPDEDGRLRAARAGLRRLRARDRLLLSLRARGLSYREIATAASINPGSVGRLLARAVDRWERASDDARPVANVFRRSSS